MTGKAQNQSKPKIKRDHEISKYHEKALKTVAKGAGIAFMGLLLGKLFAYLTRIFIARTLGPEDYGLISIGIAIISILTTFSLLGLNSGLTRFIAFYMGKRDLGKVKGSLLSSFKITLPISIIFSILLFLFSEQVALFFSKPDLVPLIQIFSFVLPFSVIMNLSDSSLLGFKLIKQKVYTVEIGKNLSTFLLVVIFFYFGFNLLGAVLGFTLGIVISSLIGLYYLRDNILHYLIRIKAIYINKEIFSFSWPLILVAFLSIFMSWTGILILSYFDTAVNVGLYQASLDTCVLLTFISSAFSFIVTPIISELYSQKKIKEIRKIYKTTNRWIFLIVFPLFLILVLFPDKVLEIMFGREFVSGSFILILLSIGYFFNVIFGISTNLILSIGKTKINFYIASIAATSNLFLSLILIPIYGTIGAAIVMLISMILWSLLPFLYINKKIGIQPFDKNYIKPLFTSLVLLFFIYFILKSFFNYNIFFIYFIGFLIFMIFYGLSLLLTKSLTKDDVLILKFIERKTGLRITWLREFIKRFY